MDRIDLSLASIFLLNVLSPRRPFFGEIDALALSELGRADVGFGALDVGSSLWAECCRVAQQLLWFSVYRGGA